MHIWTILADLHSSFQLLKFLPHSNTLEWYHFPYFFIDECRCEAEHAQTKSGKKCHSRQHLRFADIYKDIWATSEDCDGHSSACQSSHIRAGITQLWGQPRLRRESTLQKTEAGREAETKSSYRQKNTGVSK